MDLHQLVVSKDARAAGKHLAELDLPAGALVALVSRPEGYAVPRGMTVLEPNDTLLVFVRSDDLAMTREIIEGKYEV